MATTENNIFQSTVPDYYRNRRKIGIKENNAARSIIIANGEAAVLDANGIPISYPNSILNDNGIVIPLRHVDTSRIRGIFVNSGIIRFEENGAFLNFIIQECSNRTVMSQLGKVAEAVLSQIILITRCFALLRVKGRIKNGETI